MTVVKRVRLGDVVSFIRDTTKPENIDPQRNYVLLEHIVGGTGEVYPVFVGDTEIRSNKFRFEPGDILYGKLRPKLRKVCVALVEGYCSTDILPLRPHDPRTAFYLANMLRSEQFYAEVERLVGGANLPRVNAKELLNLDIPWIDEIELVRFNELARAATELRAEMSLFGQRIATFERALWVG